MSEAARVPAARVHPTAIVEPGAIVGPGTAIWDSVHVRGPATIGRDCIIGEKTYVAYGVRIGDYVKINAFVYICTGVVIEDRVMVAAGVVFTNDRYPRAFADGFAGLAPSDPNEETLETVVGQGVTIGARAVVGPGVRIGPYAMIGMGAVVASDVPAHALVYGTPASVRGWVCVCGQPLTGLTPSTIAAGRRASCTRCERAHEVTASAAGLEVRCRA
jgi:acetyltransferase-like isoleucine patch superfamily enzyme